MSTAVRPIELCYSYAHADEAYRVALEKHLKGLQRRGLIKPWHDRNISAGSGWQREIDAHFDSAQIILLLISADFINSDYCFDKEMTRAIERHDAGDARVIPIILRECDWDFEPLNRLQALPKDGEPIQSWSDQDAAYADVARRIRQLVDPLQEAAHLQETLQSSLDEREVSSSEAMRLENESRLTEAIEDMRELQRLGDLRTRDDPENANTPEEQTFRLALGTLALAEQSYDKARSIISTGHVESVLHTAREAIGNANKAIETAVKPAMIMGDANYGLGRWEQALESYQGIKELLASHSQHRVGDMTLASLANKLAVCHFQRQLELQRSGRIVDKIGVLKHFNLMKKTILEHGGPLRTEHQVRFGWEGALREDGVPRPWVKGVYVPGNACDVERGFDGDEGVLRLGSDRSSFAVSVITNVSLEQQPLLSWRWKATALPEHGDLRADATNDEAISLAVTFLDGAGGWHHLYYGWDTNAPEGTIQAGGIKLPIINLTYYNKVVSSGWEHLGQWQRIELDVLEDLRSIFRCKEPLRVVMLAVYANSQHTGAKTEAWIGPVRFARR